MDSTSDSFLRTFLIVNQHIHSRWDVYLLELRKFPTHEASNHESFTDVEGKTLYDDEIVLLDHVSCLLEVNPDISLSYIDLVFKLIVICQEFDLDLFAIFQICLFSSLLLRLLLDIFFLFWLRLFLSSGLGLFLDLLHIYDFFWMIFRGIFVGSFRLFAFILWLFVSLIIFVSLLSNFVILFLGLLALGGGLYRLRLVLLFDVGSFSIILDEFRRNRVS